MQVGKQGIAGPLVGGSPRRFTEGGTWSPAGIWPSLPATWATA